MSNSPWNVKNRRSPKPQPLSPQGAQVHHVPAQPPQSDQPRARARRSGRLALQQQGRQPVQQAAYQPAKRPKKPLSKRFLALVAAGIIAVLVSGLLLAAQQEQLHSLRSERQQAADRLLAHKQEHYNARQNSGYLGLIQKYAKENGISPSFVSAIIKCESSFKSDAVSRVNARGLMQIMPDTGTWLAGKLKISDYQPDALFDPETNIRFGTYYLAYLSDIFKGSPVMVAAAYHAGANNVKSWAMRLSSDMQTISLEQIPARDTRDYVGKVMNAYAIYFEKDQQTAAVVAGALPAADTAFFPGQR